MATATSKFCRDCNTEKNVSQFSKHAQQKDGLQVYCKQCCTKRQKNYAARNKDKVQAKARAYYQANKEAFKQRAYKSRLAQYGITVEEYDILLEEQDGCCAICKQPPLFEPRKLAVDHCHETGKVRGLLCQKCNTAIGLLGDDTDYLQAAIDYLRENN